MEHLFLPVLNLMKDNNNLDTKTEDINTETESVVNPQKYDQKKYNSTFMTKNKSKIMEKHICDVCCGSYTYYNKSKHLKSNRHIKMLNKISLV